MRKTLTIRDSHEPVSIPGADVVLKHHLISVIYQLVIVL